MAGGVSHVRRLYARATRLEQRADESQECALTCCEGDEAEDLRSEVARLRAEADELRSRAATVPGD